MAQRDPYAPKHPDIRDSEIRDYNYDEYVDNSGYEDAEYIDQSGYLDDSSSQSSQNDHNKPAHGYDHQHYFEGQPSQSATQKSLASAERGAAIGGNSSKNSKAGASGISKEEGASNPMGYKASDQSKDSDGGKSGKQRGFFSRNKKGLLAGAMGLTLMGGILGIGVIVSGPMQFIQAMNLVRNTIMFITDVQTGARSMRSMQSIARGAQAGIAGNIQYRRLGIIGNRMADNTIRNMANQGVTFGSTNIFGNAGTIDVNLTRLPFDANDLRRLDSRGVLSVNPDGTGRLNLREMSYRDAKRIVNRTNGVTRFDVVGQMKTRKTLRKVGMVSWFHPLRKLRYWIANEIADTAQDIFRAWTRYRARRVADHSGRGLAAAAAQSRRNNEPPNRRVAREQGADVAARRTVNPFEPGSVGQKVMRSVSIIGVALLVLEVACAMQEIQDNIGKYKHENITAPTMGNAAELIAIGSQVMSGENLDMDTLGAATRQRMFNPAVPTMDMVGDQYLDGNIYYWHSNNDNCYITVTHDDGSTSRQLVDCVTQPGDHFIWYEETDDDTFESSWWHGPAARVALGQQPTQQQLDDSPAELRTVTNTTLEFGGNARIQAVWGALLSATNIITGGGSLCFMADFINWIFENTIGAILGPVLGYLMGALSNIPGFDEALGNIMMSIMGWLYGQPVDLSNAPPEQQSQYDWYGARFLANEQMIANGGRELTADEYHQVAQIQREWLAEEWSKRPLLSRLLDPTDYRSTVNVIARTANFDVSSRDLRTQLGNIPRFFGALPQLFGVAFNRVSGVAHAVETAGYDFGVPEFGFSVSEMNTMISDDSFDMFENMDIVRGLLNDDMRDRVRHCFGVTIDDEMNVRQVDNSRGEAWNYVDFRDRDDCSPSGSSDRNWLRVRTYIMDYNIMLAQDCFYNNDSSSCADIGFGRGGGPGGGPSGGVVVGGDSRELAQRILDLAAEGRVTLNTGGTTSNMENRRAVRANIEDTAAGIGAMTPFPVLGGGTGRVELSPYLLSAIVYMIENFGPFTITTIAGFEGHVGGANDDHALGFAVDIGSSNFMINGRSHQYILNRLTAAGFMVQPYSYHGDNVHFHLSIHNGR